MKAKFAFLLSAQCALATVVDVGYAKYQGVSLANGVTQWLGMRYAAPPVGGLRFMPPADPKPTSGIQPADKHGKICLATGAPPGDNSTSEDCLFVNVQAPTNASSKPQQLLPVFVFIQGGGFNANSNPNLNASGLIAASGHGIVVVDFNYRVGPYGFLTDGALIRPNNGLRDQEMVLQWVQRHIGRFGGDPEHVTIGGDSAGAQSVVVHLTQRGGRDNGYFHAAAAESPSFSTSLTARESAYQYTNLAVRLGCAASTPRESLACMQRRSAAEVQAQNFNIPLPGAADPPLYMYYVTLDDEFMTDYPYRLLQQGKIVKVPAIFGDDSNGGTIFTPRNASSLVDSNRFLLDQYPFMTLDVLAAANALYPNPDSARCPAPGCYWRQVSNVYQEARYMCAAHAVTAALATAHAGQAAPAPASYAYRWDVQDPDQVAQGLGVPHTVEINAIFGPATTPDSYRPGGLNAPAVAVVQRYWSNFIRFYDPNGRSPPHSSSTTTSSAGEDATWVPWSQRNQARMLFQTGGKTRMEPFGDALNARCAFWAKNGVAMRA